MNENKTNINWYPGHMQKTKRELKEISPLIDFVIELIDARIPESSKVVGIEDIIKNKPKILVMTKKDLADPIETEKWLNHYKKTNEKVLAISLKDNNEYKSLLKVIDNFSSEINDKRISKGLKAKPLRGLVIGIPNVGKSTLINRIANKKVAGVGNMPGFTKGLNWLNAGSTLLLDSPGLLWPKFESSEVAYNLAAMSAIKTEILPIDEVAVHILKKLNMYYPSILSKRYGLDTLTDDYEYNYETISKKLGIPKLNGDIDFDRISSFIINDIKNENVTNITFDRGN